MLKYKIPFIYSSNENYYYTESFNKKCSFGPVVNLDSQTIRKQLDYNVRGGKREDRFWIFGQGWMIFLERKVVTGTGRWF